MYDFTENRKRDGPAEFLANYAGYLQADAFSGYDGIFTGSDGQIHRSGLLGACARKFFDARSSSPAEASLILEMIRRLYEVEDRARPLDDDARRELRQAEAVPILERLRDELDRLSSQLLPKSALAQAVTYALNQWQALCRYTQDGRLTIDNNVSERRVRDQAIGRKNWLFLGSDEAGPRAAVLCTIIAGAKRHRTRAVGLSARRDPATLGGCEPRGVGTAAAGPMGPGASGARAEPSPRGVAREGAAPRSAPGRATSSVQVERWWVRPSRGLGDKTSGRSARPRPRLLPDRSVQSPTTSGSPARTRLLGISDAYGSSSRRHMNRRISAELKSAALPGS